MLSFARVSTLVLNRAKQQHFPLVAMGNTLSTDMGDSKNVELLGRIFDVVKRQVLIGNDHGSDGKVVDFVQPADLGELLCSTGLEIHDAGIDDVDNLIENVVKYSVKTCHAHFYNQLYHASDAHGLAGQWLSDALNTNNHTFEVSPVFTVVERALVNYVIGKLGWSEGGDGITAPGGSLANMYGLMCARHALLPDLKSKGLFGQAPLVVFTSEDSHYSVLKGANWLGIGTENVVKVKTDEGGRMMPEELDRAIKKAAGEGKLPMAVNATSGTTVLGAYDDLTALAEVCRENGHVWLHVDACWGGSAMFCPELKAVSLKGVELVDSLAWNAHKMVGAPLQSSLFLTKRKGLLESCNSASASYLFQQDKFYDVSWDTGDKSVQCGRKVDAFQVWFMLKTRGEGYFARIVRNAFKQADYLADQVRKREGFSLVVDPHSCTNVCFVFVPPSLRNEPVNDEWQRKMSGVPPKIKEKITRDGTLLVGYQNLPHKGLANFFRMVVHGIPESTEADMDFVLDEIERCGQDV